MGMDKKMRKILFTILVLGIILGMSNCKEDKEDDPIIPFIPHPVTQNPKIYRVIYNGNGNTEGEVPVDDNLYAEGDVLFPLLWNGDMKKDGWGFAGWELIGNVKQVKRPHSTLSNGNIRLSSISEITLDKNNIELKGLYNNSPR
jgi:hypothetical protein